MRYSVVRSVLERVGHRRPNSKPCIRGDAEGCRVREVLTVSGDPKVSGFSRKEVIQPQVPLRLPCYDFTPVTSHSLGTCPPLRVSAATSGATDSHGVTGGGYKARERIHRGILIHDY